MKQYKRTILFFITVGFSTFGLSSYAQKMPSTVTLKPVTNQELAANAAYFKKPNAMVLNAQSNEELSKKNPVALTSKSNEELSRKNPVALKTNTVTKNIPRLVPLTPNTQVNFKGGLPTVPKPTNQPSSGTDAGNSAVNNKPLGIDGKNISK